MSAEPKAICRTWDEMKAIRLPREQEWQQIADYFMPRKDFSVTGKPTELMKRRITSSLGPRVLERGAALLVAYLVDAARPFISPNVDRGMVQAGRSLGLDADAQDYLDTLQWAMFDRQMLPQSGFMSSISRVAVELRGFGTGIQWIGRKRGFGPKYQARPLRSNWIGVNDEDEVDTDYFRYFMPAWKVLERYPEARKNDKLLKKGSDEKTQNQDVQLLHCVQPRKYGRAGAVATAKPYEAVLLAVDEQFVLEESGYESFPYAVARLHVEEGSPYGTGDAWYALPDVASYNWFLQMMEYAAGQRAAPPVMTPARLFAKPLDRRHGANNVYNAGALGFQNIEQAVKTLQLGGDPNAAAAMLAQLERNAEQIFHVDWMNLNDGVEKTAQEIIERRDLRIRAMSAIVPAIDRDLLGRGADRTLEAMIEENQLPAPPASLSGVEVDWDYKGPLAMMQQRGQFEAITKLIALATQAAAIDETAARHTLMISEGLRAAADALGAPTGVVASRQQYEAAVKAEQEAADQRREMEATTQAATALRDGGQGISSLAGAGPGGGQGGRPMEQAA